MKRDLRIKKEVLTELADGDLGRVVGAAPPPTVPQTECGICVDLDLGTIATCYTCLCH